MGEIADALRRARGPGVKPESPQPRVVQPVPSRPASIRPSAPAAAQSVSSIEPSNAAVVLGDSPNAEACRHLALRVRSALAERRARSVAVVSAERGDGKTTVACNLAIALATLSLDREVALVDLDLRKPAVAKALAVPHQVGIEEVLLGRATLDAAAIQVQQPAIDVYPVVTAQRAAHELLVLPEMAALIADLEKRYALVIVDTPPAPLVPDANLILQHVAACTPVVRAGKTRARSFRRLLECLPNERLLGWIVNGERAPQLYRDYYYYGEEPQRARRWLLGGESQ